jgi:hypothetical protein
MAQQEGEEKRMIEEGLGALTDTNEEMIGDEAKLINAILHRPMFSFLLIPSARNCVNILHNCISDETVGLGHIIGILGTRLSSPKKQASVKNLVQGFPHTANNPRAATHTPSLKAFLTTTSASEFLTLPGEEDGTDLRNIGEFLPNSLFLPPQLFISAVTGPTMKAEDLATKIILIASNGDEELDPEPDKEEGIEIELIPNQVTEIYQILTFLWVVASGLARAVILKDSRRS